MLLKHPYAAKSVAELFAKEIIHLHGVPKSIISDRDPLFVSNFWKKVFRMQGTQLKFRSSYHLLTDGQTKVVNKCVEGYLLSFASE